MVFEKIERGNIWTPEKEGQDIVGKLLTVRDGNYGKVYDIETKDGVQTVFGTKFLENLMEQVKEGDKVKIVFTGKEAPKVKGYSPMKTFEVFVDKG